MITIDPKDTRDALRRAAKDLDSIAEEMPGVAVRALNESLKGLKTDMKGIIRADYNIKAGAIDKQLSMERASRQNLTGKVRVKGGPVQLTDVTGTTQLKRKGVKVNLKKDTGQRVIPRAFIATARSGKKLVLRRPSRAEYGGHIDMHGRYGPPGSGGTLKKQGSPARLMSFPGPHLAVLYNSPGNWAKIRQAGADRIDTNIKRELDAELRKQQGQWG